MERLFFPAHLLLNFRRIQSQRFIQLSELSRKAKDIRNAFLKSLPYHINIISIAAQGNLKETAHSSILQKLLLHPLILNSFLKNIAEIENPDYTVDQIRPAEAERMDISIFGKEKCIIIENKVNGAEEQPGQVFRYVQNAINNKKHKYTPENINVIYLNPSDYNPPSEFSLSEKGLGEKRVSDSIINNMIIKNYREDIYKWIKELQDDEALIGQPFIQSALYQYQDYLEDKFELTDKYKPMKEDLKRLIRQEILNGLSYDENKDLSKKLKILDDYIEDLNLFKDSLEQYKKELKITAFRKLIQDNLKSEGLILRDLDKEYSYQQSNSGFKIILNGKLGFVAYGYDPYCYVSFSFEDKLMPDEKAYLKNIIKEFGIPNENIRQEKKYVWYFEVIPRDYSYLANKYIAFAKFINNMAKDKSEGMKLEILKETDIKML